MESTTESSHSSPEQQQKPQSPRQQLAELPSEDYIEKPTHVRFLVSNAAAGSVIGKGGSTITDFQSQSGSRIQLSRNNEFFPGTSDRIVLVSGTIDGVIRAVELVLSKLLSELHVEDNDDANLRTRVRLIVPNICCGGIIGKGGATIKSYIEESQAGIKISPLDNNYFGLGDRLVTVTGTVKEQMHAIDLILSRLAEDPHYPQSINTPFSYAGVYSSGFHGMPYPYVPPVPTATYNVMNYGPGGPGTKFQSNKEDRNGSMTIGIADEHIGLVVGRGGRNIAEISQLSGARIKISDRGDFISGTSDRKVTITGSQRAIEAAETMIMQKVANASERVMD